MKKQVFVFAIIAVLMLVSSAMATSGFMFKNPSQKERNIVVSSPKQGVATGVPGGHFGDPWEIQMVSIGRPGYNTIRTDHRDDYRDFVAPGTPAETVPEPTAVLLLGGGMLLLAAWGRRPR
jgi:hypothetical protein